MAESSAGPRYALHVDTEVFPLGRAYILELSGETWAALGEFQAETARAKARCSRRTRRIKVWPSLAAVLVTVGVLVIDQTLPYFLLAFLTLSLTGVLIMALRSYFQTLERDDLCYALSRFENAAGVTLVPGMRARHPVPQSLSGADPAEVLHAAVHSGEPNAVSAVLDRMSDECQRERERDVAERAKRSERLVDDLVAEAGRDRGTAGDPSRPLDR